MYRSQKLLALAVFASLFFVGCKDDDSAVSPEQEVDITKVMSLPYSELSPSDQKVKLENESIAMLEFGNAAKSSSAIEALQNLGNLLDESSVKLVEEKKVNEVKEIFEYADVYGVFTWNASQKKWDKTVSTSELKFVFPAKKKATSNNAVLSVNAVSSDITVTEKYSDYNSENHTYTDKESTYSLPKSSTGILNIDNKEAAKLELTAEYKDNKQVPVKSEYKVTTNDGYVLTGKVDKNTENGASMKLTSNDKVMFEAVAKSGIKIDQIIDLEQNGDGAKGNYALFNKANAYMKLMDNLVLVYEIDIENYVKESDAIEADYRAKNNALWGDWETYDRNENRYTLRGQYEKEESDKMAALFNKYQKVILASTKDGSKIADVVLKSEKGYAHMSYDYWNSKEKIWMYPNGHTDEKTGEWVVEATETLKYNFYNTKMFLKFNDNTLVDIETYFSEGFSKIETKWEDFVKAFDR